jgi:flavin-dependent dehydrogenase
LQECLENGVEFKFGTRYVSAEMLEGETIVKLEKKGVEFEVKTKVLVGADGANSRVAKDLRLDENKEWIVGYEEVFRKNVPLDGEPRLHCFLDARLAPGYLAWVTDDGEEVHIGVGGYAEKFQSARSVKRISGKNCAAKFVDLTKAELTETRGGRIPVGGVLRKSPMKTVC